MLPARPGAERETLFTVLGVTALSTAVFLLYPFVVQALDLAPPAAGLFLGGSIHNVPQVIGAGYVVDHETGDIATLIKDQKRAVRADLADENPGREGAYITLAFEFLMLTAKSVVAGVGKREGLGLASDIIDSVGSVVEASMLSAFPQGNEKAAAACVVSDVAFGVTQISLGLAADV